MIKLKRFSNLRPDVLILALAISAGGAIRLLPVLNANFPLNDGGLFYTMTRELIENGFRLPQFSAYNDLNIPYAYPPLGFYLTGLLSVLTGWALLDIFRILPAVFTVLSIPAFYFLARELVQDKLQSSIATFIFACLPFTTNWLIMGGGISRAPAFLFYLVGLIYIKRLFSQPDKKYVFLTALFSILIVLTHPETALYTLVSALVFLLFYGRSKQGLFRSLLVVVLTLAISAPWWATVLANHGFSPFLIASRTGDYNLQSLKEFFLFDLTGEQLFPIIRVLSFIGLFFFIFRKDYLLPVLLIILYFSDPRSGNRVIAPILALFSATCLLEISRHVFTPSTLINGKISQRFQTIVFFLLFTWMGCQMVSGMLIEVLNIPRVTTRELQDMEWISKNTPPEGSFAILTSRHPMADPFSEWFPALTGRKSVGTVQGYEWKDNPGLAVKIQSDLSLQRCIDRELSCLENWRENNNTNFNYLIVNDMTINPPNLTDSSLVDLLNAKGFMKVYDSDVDVIYKFND